MIWLQQRALKYCGLKKNMRNPLAFIWYPAKNIDVRSGIEGYYNMGQSECTGSVRNWQ
jgi:hypothetical protein